MRPHWQDMLRIETAAQRFGEGHLSERIHFDSMSSFERLGVAFNQMADNINALIASKKQLIDGTPHELRTLGAPALPSGDERKLTEAGIAGAEPWISANGAH